MNKINKIIPIDTLQILHQKFPILSDSITSCYDWTRVSSRHWRGNRSEQMLHAWFPGSRPNLFQWRGMGVGIGFRCVLDESFVLRSQCDPEKESLAAPFWTMSKSALALFQVSSNPSLYMDHGSWMVMGHLILALIWRLNVFRTAAMQNSQEPGHWASLQSSTILMKPSHGLAGDWNGCQSDQKHGLQCSMDEAKAILSIKTYQKAYQKFITVAWRHLLSTKRNFLPHTANLKRLTQSSKCSMLWTPNTTSHLRPSVGSCFMMSGESKIGCKYIHALDGSTTTLI